MRGCVFVGGDGPSPEAFAQSRQDYDLVFAADSGFDLATSYGVEVERVVGDMDSVKNSCEFQAMSPDRVLRFPTDKDETDTEIGLRLLREAGCTELTIVGGGGGRLDHLLGITSLFDRPDAPARWLLADYAVVAVDPRIEIRGKAGELISFFPAGTELCTMVSSGLKWSLCGLEWRKGNAGLSNVVSDGSASVTMISGRLIAICPLDMLTGVTS